jgi:hypothetical protein
VGKLTGSLVMFAARSKPELTQNSKFHKELSSGTALIYAREIG